MLFIPISPISVNSLNLLSKHTEFTFIEDTSLYSLSPLPLRCYPQFADIYYIGLFFAL